MQGEVLNASKLVCQTLAEMARGGLHLWKDKNLLHVNVPLSVTVGSVHDAARQCSGALLSVASTRAESSCVAPLSDSNASVALACIHVGHGGVYDYRWIARELRSECAVFGVHALHLLLAREGAVPLETMAPRPAASARWRLLED